MQFDVITLFPDMVAAPFRFSLMHRAMERGLFRLNVHDLRPFGIGRHHVCDDSPFGGGEGMVMKVEPIHRALNSIVKLDAPHRVLLLSPGGKPFRQEMARDLVALEQIVLICGHYEGVDARVSQHLIHDEVSIGDYVLTGGELAAMVLVEVVARLIPGVVQRVESIANESFEFGVLDCPQYTRPAAYEGLAVPEVLLSGDHRRVAAWRREEALRRTWLNRPDLLESAPLSLADRQFLEGLQVESASRLRSPESRPLTFPDGAGPEHERGGPETVEPST